MKKLDETLTIFCPYCNSMKVKRDGAKNKIQKFKCKVCAKQFTEDRLPLELFMMIDFLQSKQWDIPRIAKLIKCKPSIINATIQHFRQS